MCDSVVPADNARERPEEDNKLYCNTMMNSQQRRMKNVHIFYIKVYYNGTIPGKASIASAMKSCFYL